MTIKFDFDPSDCRMFKMRTILRVPALRRSYLINTFGVPVIVLIAMLLFQDAFTTLYIIGLTVIAGLLGYWLFSYLSKQIIMRLPSKNAGVCGEHTLEIDDSGIRETSPVTEMSAAWRDIYSIEQDKRFIYVYVDTIFAFVIPKRSFATAKAADDFFNAAVDYYKTNKALLS